LRRAFFGFLGRVADTPDARALAVEMLRGRLDGQPLPAGDELLAEMPYPDLGCAPARETTARRADVIFLTARFRTGSTLLWNLFRNLDGVTAYYEPLNERRWFDPSRRGDRLDPTHRKVASYWQEYDGLEELGRYYRESWIDQHLLMGADFWDPGLKRYVEMLIERARGRPVLQFNRMDFRLPWLRRQFPAATIVHLYRHPRDQWYSCFPVGDPFPPDGRMADFHRFDYFYLLSWARDLRCHFPFLDERTAAHPYQLFYYLWKLSYLFGRKYAHRSLAFERLVENPDREIADLFTALDVPHDEIARLRTLIDKPAPAKWKNYADDAWFGEHERTCESVLRDFLGRHVA
jgi:hypothetical protein